MRIVGIVILAAGLLPVPGNAAGFPEFEEVVIDPHAGEVVYAVTHADVDGDGKPDIVAVTENAVYWYQNPTWKKRIIIKDQTVRDNVCIAAHDIDGDGQIDFALGAGWLQGRNQGTIQWLSRGESLDEKWNVHFIGEIPWTHRMRWAVIDRGKPQLTVSPLNKTEGDGVKLTAFAIPADPKHDRWPATVLDDSLNRVHNHWHVLPRSVQDHFPGEREEELLVRQPSILLTASQEGVHYFAGSNGNKIKISDGAAGEKPTEQGAGEVKTGRLGRQRIIATIEPMHGHMAVAYLGDGFTGSERDQSDRWTRVILDDTLGRGHGVWCADLDGDGNDEIVVGHSDPGTGEIKGPGVFVYKAANAAGTTWTKHIIDDGGMATEDLFALDLTGNGLPDIVAGGRQTHNVKLYVNKGNKINKGNE